MACREVVGYRPGAARRAIDPLTFRWRGRSRCPRTGRRASGTCGTRSPPGRPWRRTRPARAPCRTCPRAAPLQRLEVGRARPPGRLGEHLHRRVDEQGAALGAVALGLEPPHHLGRGRQLARVRPEGHQRALPAAAGEVPELAVDHRRVDQQPGRQALVVRLAGEQAGLDVVAAEVDQPDAGLPHPVDQGARSRGRPGRSPRPAPPARRARPAAAGTRRRCPCRTRSGPGRSRPSRPSPCRRRSPRRSRPARRRGRRRGRRSRSLVR